MGCAGAWIYDDKRWAKLQKDAENKKAADMEAAEMEADKIEATPMEFAAPEAAKPKIDLMALGALLKKPKGTAINFSDDHYTAMIDSEF